MSNGPDNGWRDLINVNINDRCDVWRNYNECKSTVRDILPNVMSIRGYSSLDGSTTKDCYGTHNSSWEAFLVMWHYNVMLPHTKMFMVMLPSGKVHICIDGPIIHIHEFPIIHVHHPSPLWPLAQFWIRDWCILKFSCNSWLMCGKIQSLLFIHNEVMVFGPAGLVQIPAWPCYQVLLEYIRLAPTAQVPCTCCSFCHLYEVLVVLKVLYLEVWLIDWFVPLLFGCPKMSGP